MAAGIPAEHRRDRIVPAYVLTTLLVVQTEKATNNAARQGQLLTALLFESNFCHLFGVLKGQIGFRSRQCFV